MRFFQRFCGGFDSCFWVMVGHDHTDMKFVSPGEKGKKSYSFTTPSILCVCVCVGCTVCSYAIFLFKISTKFQVHFLLLNLHICGSDLHNTLLPFRQHISTPANVLSFLWRILQHSFLFINPGPGCRDSSLSREAQTSLFCPDTSSSSTGGELEVFPGQLRDIVPPAVLWSSSGPL